MNHGFVLNIFLYTLEPGCFWFTYVISYSDSNRHRDRKVSTDTNITSNIQYLRHVHLFKLPA